MGIVKEAMKIHEYKLAFDGNHNDIDVVDLCCQTVLLNYTHTHTGMYI